MNERPLDEHAALPLLVTPETAADACPAALTEWLRGHRAHVDTQLHSNGGLLLRGFRVKDDADFEQVARSVSPRLLDYVGGESPRTKIQGAVYSSTEYPAHLEIALHSELSYAARWPSRILFCCVTPAATGGETHLADTRRILAALGSDVGARFERRGVSYLTRYHDGWGFGKSWQQTFETTLRDVVEEHLRAEEVTYRWADDGLCTKAVRPAVIRHPVTGERVWFNQADRWHVTSRGAEAARRLIAVLGEEGLPRHATYGDGSPIGGPDLERVRAAYRDCERRFDWHAGDVLLLDNLLTAHGRKPFTGSRQVLVAMA